VNITPVFDVVTGDLSFISLTLVLPALVPLLAPGGHLLMLVKPQFELQPGQVGKGGIVRDARCTPWWSSASAIAAPSWAWRCRRG
jgi:23S rRNA (cytidine1920-2'-O)/16S rRNA (cytidine1409-2'-O)-methyltransferase